MVNINSTSFILPQLYTYNDDKSVSLSWLVKNSAVMPVTDSNRGLKKHHSNSAFFVGACCVKKLIWRFHRLLLQAQWGLAPSYTVDLKAPLWASLQPHILLLAFANVSVHETKDDQAIALNFRACLRMLGRLIMSSPPRWQGVKKVTQHKERNLKDDQKRQKRAGVDKGRWKTSVDTWLV